MIPYKEQAGVITLIDEPTYIENLSVFIGQFIKEHPELTKPYPVKYYSGKDLKELRLSKEWTQEKLAYKCDISRRHLARMENDCNPLNLKAIRLLREHGIIKSIKDPLSLYETQKNVTSNPLKTNKQTDAKNGGSDQATPTLLNRKKLPIKWDDLLL